MIYDSRSVTLRASYVMIIDNFQDGIYMNLIGLIYVISTLENESILCIFIKRPEVFIS